MTARIRKHFWDLLLAGFVIAVFTYGTFRARHDLRWSSWAEGDAMALNAAIHLAREGFMTHYFLEYYHPGFLGKSVGNESPVGYYTRYPPFCSIWNGLLIRLLGENRAILKSFSVGFAVFGLIFSYLTFCQFFSKRIAFFATAFIGSSIGFLQMMDTVCAYIYSEGFRFAILFLFLLWNISRAGPVVRFLLFSALWLLVFLESANSLDYYFFIQSFFWLYYLLLEKKLPWLRLILLAAAPVIAFSLHFLCAHLALHPLGMSAVDALFKLFPEKTAPFHKGILDVVSFVTYFFRMMDGYMVKDNFGFGFAAATLMAGSFFVLRFLEKGASGAARTTEGHSIPKLLLLFALPSVSWWVVFPNQSASFFNTPMHVFPIVGLVFALALDASYETLRNRAHPLFLRTGALLITLGCLWSPATVTGKYLKEYPNLLGHGHRTVNGMINEMEQEKIIDLIDVSRKIRGVTRDGDIVIVPRPFKGGFEDFAGFHAQRRMDYPGETTADFKRKVKELEDYRSTGAKKYKVFDPALKLFALVDALEKSEISGYCSSRFKVQAEWDSRWILFDLDSSLKF